MAAKKKKETASKKPTINVYDTDGNIKGKVQLPEVFRTPFRPDLIRKAVVSAQANRRQRYGPSKVAGMRHAVSTWGKGRGVARVQRLSQGRTAAESPNNVGGRRAHPPRPEHSWSKKMNRKEKQFAVASALAATSDKQMVRSRGHRFDEKVTLPVVVEDSMEDVSLTKDVRSLLESLGLHDDIKRSAEGKHIRAGRGKMRGRRFRQPRSVLLVASEGSSILRGGRNLPGINTSTPENINAELLAPGGDPGRLVVFSKKAFESIGGDGK
ncbi:MAG: 50S ribosomal protein L4 [Thermoplasmatota archaeon]